MQEPTVGRIVHYVSYGTPGGEYTSRCRAATIAETGAWMTVPGSESTEVTDSETPYRTIEQRWEPDACALVVQNPTGLFFNTCSRDEAGGPGTWHWPEHAALPPAGGAVT